jgi:hypothetical protein
MMNKGECISIVQLKLMSKSLLKGWRIPARDMTAASKLTVWATRLQSNG